MPCASSHTCCRTSPPAPVEPRTSYLQMAPQRLYTLSVMLVWSCVVASSSSHIPVAPPRDLQITDPGLLGPLDIEWKPPPDVQTSSECTVKYKFEYRNTGDTDWKVIFTRRLKFRVGFDLSRTAEVKVQTLLEGRCTNGVEVQSDWISATFPVPLQGKLESQVQNFHCIYHDWEYLKCTWQPGLLAPRGAHYGLYYWYEGLDQAAQCDHYIQDHGLNVGCTLRNLSQAEYQDLNICVNGSAAATPLRPLYSTLHLHNLGKESSRALATPMATTHPRLTPCVRGLQQMWVGGCNVSGWISPQRRGSGGLQCPGVFAGEQHHSVHTPEGQRVPSSAGFSSWTAWDINGRWQSSYGVFGSSSTVTEISSFTPDGIETTALLFASTGELFRCCCSNQAKDWEELSARCDGVCQSRGGFQTHQRQGKEAKHNMMCKPYMHLVFIMG
ncbi:interleukin-13 receptor subunit alpha-2-like isoform X1 [Pseudopipra pipra]|uniref:interleukin-13 receptor subunit alpha-2-like isoform X1 n=1 Tax=Pseudopipra pipra TaxID=415032 RepID=UPI0031389782